MRDWQWELGIWGGATAASVLGLGLLALWLFELRSIRGEKSAARRLTLGALGGLSMLAVYALALQITLVREAFEEIAGGTVLLVDNSRSMTLSGSAGERSDAVRALIRRWQQDPEMEPIVYRFGSATKGARWTDLADTYNPTDEQTDIGEGLDTVLKRADERELGSVVVITDAADPTFRSDALSLNTSAPAIHSVVVGGDDRIDDQAIVSLRADSTAYVGVPAVIRAEVRALGRLRNEALPVQLWRDDQLLETREAALDAEGRGTVTFEVIPKRPGRALYRLVIPERRGDAVPQNNARAALLRVGRERVRVLLVAGRPSWDVRFLRDFIKRDGSVDLISFFILRAPSDLTAAPTNELALIPFPTDELFREHLGSFDVVIFQNFDFAPYDMQAYLPRIRDYVERGGSFVMIGGDHSFALGGYKGTPIEDILPVELSPGGNVVSGRYRARPSRQLIRHPIIALGPDPGLIRRTWQTLPPLEGANAVSKVREDASVLLEHPRARLAGGRRLPVLVVGESGRGRVAAMMTDATWRWRFAGDDESVGSDEYELFWDRLVRWLTRDPLLEPARISTDRDRYAVGSPVIVSGLLRDSRYRPLADREVSLRVEPSDAQGERLQGRTDRDGQLRASLAGPAEPGAYEVIVSLDGKDLASEVFLVEQSGDELATIEANAEELEAAATQTGGRVFFSVNDVPALSELAATTRKTAGLISKQPLLNPVFLFLTVLVLAATWLLRRRWGRR